MTNDIFNLEGFSNSELNRMANEWLDKALFDPNYTEFYRDIYKFYNDKIYNNTNDLEVLEHSLEEREIGIF
jgi:hypothetical protein